MHDGIENARYGTIIDAENHAVTQEQVKRIGEFCNNLHFNFLLTF